MHKISNRIFEIFFKKTLDFLLAGFRFQGTKRAGSRFIAARRGME